MIVSRLTLAAAALWACIGSTPGQAADDPIERALKPHRAVYAMGLAGTTGVGGPTQVRGVMYYEMTETCDAWKIDTKVLLRTVYAGGEEEVENLRKMTTWESKDGLGFRFRGLFLFVIFFFVFAFFGVFLFGIFFLGVFAVFLVIFLFVFAFLIGVLFRQLLFLIPGEAFPGFALGLVVRGLLFRDFFLFRHFLQGDVFEDARIFRRHEIGFDN